MQAIRFFKALNVYATQSLKQDYKNRTDTISKEVEQSKTKLNLQTEVRKKPKGKTFTKENKTSTKKLKCSFALDRQLCSDPRTDI